MPRWLKQLVSYVVSFVAYSWLLSPKVALVLMGAVAFHECGHLYAAKMMGLRTKGFYLIPFIGGAALIADRYKRYTQMSFVLLAGPIAGTVLAIVFYGLFLITGSAFIGTAAYWMALLNLFNLIPLAMLDGGQLAEAIVYSINDRFGAWYLTISYALGTYVVWNFNPFVAGVIAFYGVPAVLSAWKEVSLNKQGFENLLLPKPEKMSLKEIGITLMYYVGTAVVLLTLMYLCKYSLLNPSDLFKR